jgi:hypothetical protein
MRQIKQDLATLENTVDQCIAEIEAQRGKGIESTKPAELMKILRTTKDVEAGYRDENGHPDKDSPARIEKIAGMILRLKKKM